MISRPTATHVPAGLAQPLIAEGHLTLGHDKRLYRYESGLYISDGETWLRARCRDELGVAFRQSVVSEVVAYAKSAMPVRFDAATDLVNLRNGLLDWRAGLLQPHSAGHLSTVQLPVVWDPLATCPNIDSFFNDVLQVDLHPFVEEIIGLLLVPEVRYRKAVLLRGSGRNGKSTLLTVIRSLLGHGNVSAVGLQALSSDKFKVAELDGKLANICADIDYRAARDSSMFKIITGGTDYLTAERKFGQPFNFRPTARLLFSANEAPASTDQSQAYFDRWLVIPMDKRIERVDPDLDAKLTTPEELSGLLNRAVAGLQRLQRRRGFDVPEPAEEALRTYRQTVDSVAGFLAERQQPAAQPTIRRSELYQQYSTWCDDNGHHKLGERSFTGRLRALVPNLGETKLAGQRCWTGLDSPASTEPADVEVEQMGEMGQMGQMGQVDPTPPDTTYDEQEIPW